MDEADLFTENTLSDLLDWEKESLTGVSQDENIAAGSLSNFELLEGGPGVFAPDADRAAAAGVVGSDSNQGDVLKSPVSKSIPSTALHPQGIQALAPARGQQEASAAPLDAGSNRHDLPPFELFGAPIELRTNFVLTQRALGLPVLNDTNTQHFGEVVNGFHPQQQSQQGDQKIKFVHRTSVQYKQERALKEQRRSQKISALIDDLRDKITRDGWKLNGHGYQREKKFQTLASSADYIKHLQDVNLEKEAKIDAARNELNVIHKKIEDFKAQQPSEPESTTSSLTISSASGHSPPNEGRTRKMNAIVTSYESSLSGGASGKEASASDTRSCKAESSLSGSTDSRGILSSDYKTRAVSKDMSTKQPSSVDANSLSANFRLDYEEVFRKAHVPNVIALTSGRIVAWNDFFLRVTGLSDDEIDKLTIFSFVPRDKLSSLFAMAASALRSAQTRQTTAVGIDYGSLPSQISFPCVRFHKKHSECCPLFMTVALASDGREIFFNCIFTDSAATSRNTPPCISKRLFQSLVMNVTLKATKRKAFSTPFRPSAPKKPKVALESTSEHQETPKSSEQCYVDTDEDDSVDASV